MCYESLRHLVPVCPAMTSPTRVAVRIWTTLGIVLMTSSALRDHHVEGITLAPVSWNMSNPIFKTSKNDHVIEVKLYDDIDFVCPFHPLADNHMNDDVIRSGIQHAEHYIVYMVTKSEYTDCNVYDEMAAVMMLNCSNPRLRKRFTILFEPFQSIPNVPEYHPGETYYFITTSTGSRHGIGNLYQGACANRNMKLTIRVCCHPAIKTKSHSVSGLTSETKNDVQHMFPQLAHSTTLTDLSTVTTPSESNYTGNPTQVRQMAPVPTSRWSHQRHRTRPTLRPHLHHTVMQTSNVDAGPTGKPPPEKLPSSIAENRNSIDKLIEDMSNAKQAGLYTNSAAVKRTFSWRHCTLPVLTLILKLFSDARFLKT